MSTSIFDLLEPEPEPTGFRGAVGSAIQSLSGQFAQAIPRLMEDPDVGFGAPARQQKAQRAERRSEALQTATALFDQLDPDSKQALVDRLAPGLKLRAPRRTEEEQERIDFKTALLNSVDAGPARSNLAQSIAEDLGVELDQDTLDAIAQDDDPLGLIRRQAVAVLESMEPDDRFEDLDPAEIGRLELAGLDPLGKRFRGKQGRGLTPAEQITQLKFEVIRSAFQKRATGEELTSEESSVLQEEGFAPKPPKDKDNRIRLLGELNKNIETALTAGQKDRAAVLQEVYDETLADIVAESEEQFDQGLPIVDEDQLAFHADAALSNAFKGARRPTKAQAESLISSVAGPEALEMDAVKQIIQHHITPTGQPRRLTQTKEGLVPSFPRTVSFFNLPGGGDQDQPIPLGEAPQGAALSPLGGPGGVPR
jgi:hypothetical protein